ncbi:MAG: hypothetical protein WC821_01010 [archaeon]
MPTILFLDGLLADMTLVLKIFVLLTIISYVTQHMGKGPVALMVIAVLSYFIIFDYFMIFGGIYILYMLVLFGVTQLLMDFFILAPQAAMEQSMEGGGGELPGQPNGPEFREKQHRLMQMRRARGMG